MSKESYDAWSRVISLMLKAVGVLGIVVVLLFWMVTGKIELAFLPFFGTMAGVGQGLDVLKEISQSRDGASTQKPPYLPHIEEGSRDDL